MTVYDSTGDSYYAGSTPSPISEVSSTTDIQPSLTTWENLAHDLGEFDLVLAIQASQDDPDPLVQAHVLLAKDDPTGAHRVLSPDSDPLPALGAGFALRDMLMAACRASMGDDEAHRWLLQSAALVADQQVGWHAAYLVAVASDLRGDVDAADRAWRLVVERYSVTTSHVTARLVAAHVIERRGEDGLEATRRLAEASTSLEHVAHSIAADPRPTLAAVDTLIERNDTSGARLLLEIVTRRNEVNPTITGRLSEITPQQAMRRYRWLVICGFALVPFAFLLGGPGLLLVFGCSWLFRSQVRVPGFSGPDSVVWRATRQLRLDPGSGVATTGNPDRGWIALAVIGGGVVGILIGALLMPLVQGLGDWAVVGAWLGPLVLCAGFAYQLASRWSRTRQRRARLVTRKEITRKEVAIVGPCQCWNTTALADEVADAYTKRHLVESGFDVDAANMTTAFGRRVRLLRCPSLGTIWLSADLTAEGASLLMRGDGETAEDGGTAESAGDAHVGFYL